MKLYQSNLSPFAARCRIQIHAKGIEGVEMVEPPGGISSDEFKKINPSGKIPALEVDGVVLGESAVICEYLEDVFPTPSLLPDSPIQRGIARLLARVADLYILGPLFVMLPHLDPEDRDAAVVEEQKARLRDHFTMLERYLVAGGYKGGDHAVGDRLTLADCALVPALFVAVNILPVFGTTDPLVSTANVAAYWQAIQKDESCSRVLAEMTEGLKARMSGG